MPTLRIVPDHLRRRRLKLPAKVRTLRFVAGLVSVAPSTLSRWERGLMEIRPVYAQRWLQVIESLESADAERVLKARRRA